MDTSVFVSNLISHRLHQAWRLTPIVTIMKVARHQSKHWWWTAGGSPIRGSKFGHLGRRGFHLLVILEGELLLKDLCPWFILIHLTNSCPCSKFFRSRSIASSYLGSSLLSHMNRLSEGRDCWFTTDWSAGCPLMFHIYVMERVRWRIMDWRDIEDPQYEEQNSRDEKQDQT